MCASGPCCSWPCSGTAAGRSGSAIAAEIGFGAVPIVVLINLMIGVILAIQMAYVLRDYGATIFIAKVVGISMSREIGPLLCAILVAGRSGSAIAAEIGFGAVPIVVLINLMIGVILAIQMAYV
ncbi:MAG: MlaE family ABC transporter permease, partial [Planctomycetota bacterium]